MPAAPKIPHFVRDLNDWTGITDGQFLKRSGSSVIGADEADPVFSASEAALLISGDKAKLDNALQPTGDGDNLNIAGYSATLLATLQGIDNLANAAEGDAQAALTAVAAKLDSNGDGSGLTGVVDQTARDAAANALQRANHTGSQAIATVTGLQAALDLKATIAYADSLVVGLLDDRGNYSASGNTFPASGGSGTAGAILRGDLWTISAAGTLGGVAVTAGDVVRALSDTPGQTAGNWAIGENNFGYVALNQALADGKIYIGNGSGIGTAVTPSGDITFTNAGVTAIGSSKVTNAMLAGSIAYSKLSLTGAILNADLAGSIALSKLATDPLARANHTGTQLVATIGDSTTVGQNLVKLTNPGAITFLRLNADNSVTARSAANFRSDIGAGTGAGDALAASPLSQFAATTSAQLRGVLSDENGTGVFLCDSSTSATFITPILGTPTSGNLVNCTFPTLNQSTTGSAATLTTPRAINGTNFDGSAAITVTAAAGTLTGVTLAGGVTASSLTSAAGGTFGTAAFTAASAYATSAQGTKADSAVQSIATPGVIFTNPVSVSSGAATLALINQTANTVFAGPTTGAATTPTMRALVAADIPTLNQSTTGSAASLTTARGIYGNNFDGTAALTQIVASTYGGTGNGFTKFSGPTTSERTKTLRDATDTILELGGSYTPTGTWTSLTLVTPVLGTPASGTVTNLTGTASININGTVGATTPTTGAFTTLTNTGAATNSVAGAASTPAIKLTGAPFAGTGTTSFPLLYLNDAAATASTTLNTAGTYLGVNGHGTQDLMNLLKDGVSSFKVSSGGIVTVLDDISTSGAITCGAAQKIIWNGRSRFYCQGDGSNYLSNTAQTGYTLLGFGGTTNSFNAIARDAVNGFTIQSAAGTATFNDGSTANSGTVSNRYLFGLAAPTLTATGTSVTNTVASTVYIGGAPTDSTNTTSTTKWALNVAAGNVNLAGITVHGAQARLKGYTVATLPGSPTQGDTVFVTDALAPTFGATIVGGGAIVSVAFYNGSNWVAF